MGYDSYVTEDIELKDSLTAEQFNAHKQQWLDTHPDNADRSEGRYIIEDMEFNSGSWFNASIKWFSEKAANLSKFIAPLVEEGSMLTIQGDDSDDRWRVVFDGKGGFKEEAGILFYGELYDHFILTYGSSMPHELIEALAHWKATHELVTEVKQ